MPTRLRVVVVLLASVAAGAACGPGLVQELDAGLGTTNADDAGAEAPDSGVEAGPTDSGVDAGAPDGGVDAGLDVDAGVDAGATGAGTDSGVQVDAGVDVDAGGPGAPLPSDGGCACGSTDPAAPCFATRFSSSAGPSTITFDFACDGGPCRCGLFANQHDAWVAPLTDDGEVQLVGLTPATLGTPGQGDYRNGWVVNPTSQRAVGLDGRFYAQGNHRSPQDPSPAAPYTIATAQGAQSLWKAEHYPDAIIGSTCMNPPDAGGDTRMCFLQVALLTVLPRVPPQAGVATLRPPGFGTDKPLYDVGGLDLGFLPNLPVPVRPGGDTVNLNWDQALGDLAFPTADWGADYPATQVSHAKYGWAAPISNGYRAYEPAEHVNAALSHLLFAASGADVAKKRLLAIRAVQQGLDLLAIYRDGDLNTVGGRTRGGFNPNGGHAVGRLTQALLAAQALSPLDGQWKALFQALYATPQGPLLAAETGQFSWNATSAQYTYGVVNVPGLAATYRQNCTATVVSNCQGVNSIMADPAGLYDDWPEDGTYLNQGAYQAIAWNSTVVTATFIRAAPALRTFAFPGTVAYVRRMVDEGTRVNTAVTTPLKPLSACATGLNAGRVCRTSADCGGATCTNKQTNFSRYTWPAVNVWQHYDACLDARTCPGQPP